MREHRGRWGSDFGAIQSWAINNIESLATEAGIKLHNGRGACPFHGGKNRNMAVKNGKRFFCFKCQAKGDGVEFIRLLRFGHLPRREGRVAAMRESGFKGITDGLLTAPSFEMDNSPRGPAPAHPSLRSRDGRAALADRSRRVALSSGESWKEARRVYAVLSEELTLGELGRRYLGEERLLGADHAHHLGVRSIENWSAILKLFRLMEITPSEALNAGFVLAGEYPDSLRTHTHISPKYARFGCPCLVFFYSDENGVCGLTLRSLGSVMPKVLAVERNAVRSPWGVEALRPVPHAVHICEGEIDALTLRRRSLPAISVPGGNSVPGGADAPWLERVVEAERIFLWMDLDEGGHQAERRLLRCIRRAAHRCGTSPDLRVIRHNWPDHDVNDLHRVGKLDELIANCEDDHAC